MKSISTSRLAMIAVAATSLGLAACNDPADDGLEKQADQVEAASDAAADRLEDKADTMSGTAEDAMENKADQVEAAGEAKADALEDKADKVEDNN